MKVLLVEDSERLRRSLRHGLERSGFAVDAVEDGEQGLAFARLGSYDVVVLDLMLPRMDGLEVLRRLREEGRDVHVLILSARDEVAERVEGLRLGADDYLPKPFEFEELLARLRALVRRRYRMKSPVQHVGDLAVDTAACTLSLRGQSIALTRNEYALLEHLVACRGRVVSKAELLAHLYADDAQGSENAIEVFIHQLRRKIRDAGHPDVIETRRGLGYLIGSAS